MTLFEWFVEFAAYDALVYVDSRQQGSSARLEPTETQHELCNPQIILICQSKVSVYKMIIKFSHYDWSKAAKISLKFHYCNCLCLSKWKKPAAGHCFGTLDGLFEGTP